MTAHVPAELRRQVAKDAGHRCGYCLSDELLTGVSLAVDHIAPTAKAGETARENLWLACRPCNEYKGKETHAPDPQDDVPSRRDGRPDLHRVIKHMPVQAHLHLRTKDRFSAAL